MIWENLINDPQTALGILEHQKSFRVFVENKLPQILEKLKKREADIFSLMQAQHIVAEYFAKQTNFTHPGFEKIRSGLSEYKFADVFLHTVGITEEEYWQKRPGLTDSELSEVMKGAWSIDDLLIKRPAVILGPILRPTKYLN